jgi:hypothetical protein
MRLQSQNQLSLASALYVIDQTLEERWWSETSLPAKQPRSSGRRGSGVTMWHFAEGMTPPDDLFFTQSNGLMQLDIVAPTAQEIADQLPGSGRWWTAKSRQTITPPTTAAATK